MNDFQVVQNAPSIGKRYVIFDLDGTLALIHKRRQVADLGGGKIDWDKFFDPANIQLDEPNVPVIQMAQLLHANGLQVIILSGRSKRTKAETAKWLDDNKVPYHVLKMRPDDESGEGHWHFMSDNTLKQHWLDTLFEDKDEIFGVFDDRNQVVDMWRDNGLTCFQVADGNF